MAWRRRLLGQVHGAGLETARLLVEADELAIQRIAARTGFSDPERMRRAFLRTFGETPQALERAARARGRGRAGLRFGLPTVAGGGTVICVASD
jgi:AraC-like DNA-binding protein